MPTILLIGPYRFHFYSCENNEPPHIHVARDDLEAKFWLQSIILAVNYGFPSQELNKINTLVSEHREELIKAWEKVHG